MRIGSVMGAGVAMMAMALAGPTIAHQSASFEREAVTAPSRAWRRERKARGVKHLRPVSARYQKKRFRNWRPRTYDGQNRPWFKGSAVAKRLHRRGGNQGAW